jgi:hypothetical protein
MAEGSIGWFDLFTIDYPAPAPAPARDVCAGGSGIDSARGCEATTGVP